MNIIVQHLNKNKHKHMYFEVMRPGMESLNTDVDNMLNEFVNPEDKGEYSVGSCEDDETEESEESHILSAFVSRMNPGSMLNAVGLTPKKAARFLDRNVHCRDPFTRAHVQNIRNTLEAYYETVYTN